MGKASKSGKSEEEGHVARVQAISCAIVTQQTATGDLHIFIVIDLFS